MFERMDARVRAGPFFSRSAGNRRGFIAVASVWRKWSLVTFSRKRK